MRRGGIQIALVLIDAFTAITAVGGGVALITGLEGERFPPALLEGTPFRSYTIPGLLLAGAVGGSATIATLATVRSPKAGGRASALAGGIMMAWIVGELILLRQPSVLELGYFVVGCLMTLLGLRLGRAGHAHGVAPTGERAGNA